MKVFIPLAFVAVAAGSAAAASAPLVGGNPCTWGPSYWCASSSNIEKCGFDVKECKKYCKNAKEYPDIQKGDVCNPPGSNPCLNGPAYWCASLSNAKKCDFDVKGCAKYCKNAKENGLEDSEICNPPAPMVGKNKCTQGPSFFCASVANAKKCGTDVKDCKKYCKGNDYPEVKKGDICKPKPKPVGSDKCTQGPSYFCSSATHAKACGADVKDCKKYCNKDYPDVLKGDLCLLQQ